MIEPGAESRGSQNFSNILVMRNFELQRWCSSHKDVGAALLGSPGCELSTSPESKFKRSAAPTDGRIYYAFYL